MRQSPMGEGSAFSLQARNRSTKRGGPRARWETAAGIPGQRNPRPKLCVPGNRWKKKKGRLPRPEIYVEAASVGGPCGHA